MSSEDGIFLETRMQLQKLGLPSGDLWHLPDSAGRFPDGAHFRIEVPTVNSADCCRALFESARRLGVTINRVTETLGMFRHTPEEMREYLAITRDHGAELVMSVGPRATYDTSATALSPQGVRIGYRLRGAEQLVRAIEDVKRGIDLGIRWILVYDEGLLSVLAQMRAAGDLPSDVHFKVSAHCGHGNPASFKLLESLGADSINPVRDLQLPMIAALRAAVSAPIDLHTDNPPASGGFIRTYEAPEMVRIAAPVHLKTGNSAVSAHGLVTTAHDGHNMAIQASLVVETVRRYYPDATQSEPMVVAVS